MEQKQGYHTGAGQKNKSIWVDPAVHALLKAQAAGRGISLKEYMAYLAHSMRQPEKR